VISGVLINPTTISAIGPPNCLPTIADVQAKAADPQGVASVVLSFPNASGTVSKNMSLDGDTYYSWIDVVKDGLRSSTPYSLAVTITATDGLGATSTFGTTISVVPCR
jgi:hypothetical protein